MSVKFQDHQIFDAETCMRGLNILGHAQMIELDVGSECGGYGKCGKDRVYVQGDQKSLVNAPTEAEKKHLSTEEIAQGMRLACQCFPNADGLSINVQMPLRPNLR